MEKDKEKKKFKAVMLIPIAGILIGIALLMIPVISNHINNEKNSKAISSMTAEYDKYADNPEVIEEYLEQAKAFNAQLAGEETGDENVWDYEKQLSFDGDGVMAYIEIPKINLKMLIYHGTSDEVLAVGAGHLEGTSLPVGGMSTHWVITAHSGMKTMKAFDDLRQIEVGDRFTVTTLGTSYEYEIESIETVLPYETESLGIVEGEDKVTLVTCTPYGINDHRLLVHGVRIED